MWQVAWKVVRVVLLLALLAVLYLVFSVVHGCNQNPWDKYSMDREPDISCHTGSVAGWSVYVWSCVDGERVVIAKMSAEMFAEAPRKDTAACGEQTDLEREIFGGVGGRLCRPTRASPWGGGPGRVPTIEATYARAGSASDTIVRALDRLGEVDHFADLDSYGDGRVVLELPASITPRQLAADRTAVEADGTLRFVSVGPGSDR